MLFHDERAVFDRFKSTGAVQHTRQPVLFQRHAANLAHSNVFLKVQPDSAWRSPALHQLPAADAQLVLVECAELLCP